MGVRVRRPERVRRWSALKRWSKRGLVALLILVALVALLAVLALKTSPGRAFVAARANGALSGLFAGEVEIERIGWAGFAGVAGVDFVVRDPRGRPVLAVTGCAVEADWPRIVVALLTRPPSSVAVDLEKVSCDHVDVRLIDDGAGAPSIARAFATKKSAPAATPNTGAPAVFVHSIRIDRVWLHGALSGAPPVDVELRDVRAELESARKFELTLEHAAIVARGLPLVARSQGALSGELRIDSDPPETTVRVVLDGTTGGTEFELEAALVGRRVEAELEAPQVSATLARRLSPLLDLDSSVALIATASGTLDELSLRIAVTGAQGTAKVNGTLSAGDRLELEAALATDALDLAGVVRGAPHTELELDGQVSLHVGDTLSGAYRMRAGGSTILNQRISDFLVDGRLHRANDGALTLSGTVSGAASGVSAAVDYRFVDGERTFLLAGAEIGVGDSSIVSRLTGVDLEGEIDAKLRYDVGQELIGGDVDARLSRVGVPGGPYARGMRVDARVSGSVEAPSIDARVSAERLEAAGLTLRNVSGRVQGSLERAQVSLRANQPGKADLVLSARVSVSDHGFELTNVELMRRSVEPGAGSPLRMSVDELRVEDGGVVVRDLEITGAGRARASFELDRGLKKLEVEASAVDIGRLARELGLKLPVREGRVSARGHYSRASGEGELRATAQGSLNVAPPAYAEAPRSVPFALVFDLEMYRHAASGRISGTLAGAVLNSQVRNVRLTPEALEQPYLALDANSSVTIEGDLELGRLSRTGLLAPLGLERAAGSAEFIVHLRGAAAGQLPSVLASVHTRELALTEAREEPRPKSGADAANESAPRAIRGIDIHASLMVSSPDSEAAISGRLFGDRGTLVEFDARAEVPARLARKPSLLASARDWPLEAMLVARQLELQNLPPQIRPTTVQGRLAARASLAGTLRNPEVAVRIDVADLHERSAQEPSLPPLDAQVDLAYRPTGGSLAVHGTTGNGDALSARSSWSGDLVKLPAALEANAPSPVTGRLELELQDFPLGPIPFLRARNLRGIVDARLELEDFGRDPRLGASARVTNFAIGSSELGDVALSARLAGAQIAGTMAFAGKGASGRVEGSTTLSWGERVLPTLTEERALAANVENFELATLLPLVRGPVSELSGKLDANLRLVDTSGARTVDGWLTLADGAVQVPAIGQRFHEIEAAIVVANQEVTLERLRASGMTGELSATGSARLSGFDVMHANATLRIDDDEKIPVTLEGVPLGDAWGEAEIEYAHEHQEQGGKTTRVDVELSRFHVALPALAPDGVQELEPAATIEAGFFRKDGSFVALPLQPVEEDGEEGDTRVVVRVELGSDVWVHQGTTLVARFRGAISTDLSEEENLRGRVELVGGVIDVSGKRFQLEQGTITFNGPIEDAVVTATARWDSPTEYTVYADFKGTVGDGDISLRSEPPLTDDEILNLLLFGTPEGRAAGTGSEAATALSVAGGSATRSLNQLLQRFTELDLQARIDTSTGSARPELVWELSPRLTARLTRALGEPPPGQSPDRTFLRLELRLRQRWSISTVVGDRGGTGFEVLWRLRF